MWRTWIQWYFLGFQGHHVFTIVPKSSRTHGGSPQWHSGDTMSYGSSHFGSVWIVGEFHCGNKLQSFPNTSRPLSTFSPEKNLVCWVVQVQFVFKSKTLESSSSFFFFCEVRSHHPRSWPSICFVSAKLCGIAWQLALLSVAELFQRALAKGSHLKHAVMGAWSYPYFVAMRFEVSQNDAC